MDQEVLSSYEIIDAHAHIFPEKIVDAATVNIGKFYDLKMHCIGSSKMLIEEGSKAGVSKYLVCSTATKPHQVESINQFIGEECRLHKEFYGFGTLHPESDNIEAEITEINKLGLHGVKLHPDFQKFNMDSPRAYKIYEQIEGKLPVLIHCGDSRYEYSAPKKVANIHRDFPNLKIIAAHFGGYERWDEAQEYIAGLENVKVDTCSSMYFLGTDKTRKLISKFGIGNCFFGVDFPMWRHIDELKMLFDLNLSHDDNQKILADNFKSFMNI